MTNESNKKNASLIAELFSTDPAKVGAALEKIPEKGDSSVIVPLLKTYRAWEHEEEIRKQIAKILFELKTEAAIPELIAALDDPDFEEHRAFLISVFWNAGIFPVAHIDVLVRHAIKGDYMVALEVLTVVENIDTKMDPEMLQNAMFDIDEYIEMYPDDAHIELLEELNQILSSHYNA
jgi:hypothetical protein